MYDLLGVDPLLQPTKKSEWRDEKSEKKGDGLKRLERGDSHSDLFHHPNIERFQNNVFNRKYSKY